MRRSAWACAATGAFTGVVGALVWFAPATWLAAWVHDASQGQVVLARAQGSVWQGSAQLELGGGQGSLDKTALPGAVRWQLRPAWSGLRIALHADCCTPQGVQVLAAPRWGGVDLQVADAQTQWPAALLGGLGTPWNTLQPEGELKLVTRALALQWVQGRVAVAGQATLDALGMSSRLSTLRPMGSYRLSLTGGAVTGVQMETLDGSLILSGSGQWAGSRLRFEGAATAAPERAAALNNLLNIIGRRDGARSIISVG